MKIFFLKVVLKREVPRYRIILDACVHHQESNEIIFLPIYELVFHANR